MASSTPFLSVTDYVILHCQRQIKKELPSDKSGDSLDGTIFTRTVSTWTSFSYDNEIIRISATNESSEGEGGDGDSLDSTIFTKFSYDNDISHISATDDESSEGEGGDECVRDEVVNGAESAAVSGTVKSVNHVASTNGVATIISEKSNDDQKKNGNDLVQVQKDSSVEEMKNDDIEEDEGDQLEKVDSRKLAKGTKLGDIEHILNSINNISSAELSDLHRLCFGRHGPAHEIKNNIRQFSGYLFDEDSQEFVSKRTSVTKWTLPKVNGLAGILGIKRRETKEYTIDAILKFCLNPDEAFMDKVGITSSRNSNSKSGKAKKLKPAAGKRYKEAAVEMEEDAKGKAKTSKASKPSFTAPKKVDDKEPGTSTRSTPPSKVYRRPCPKRFAQVEAVVAVEAAMAERPDTEESVELA